MRNRKKSKINGSEFKMQKNPITNYVDDGCFALKMQKPINYGQKENMDNLSGIHRNLVCEQQKKSRFDKDTITVIC